jgi:hypothetical protein
MRYIEVRLKEGLCRQSRQLNFEIQALFVDIIFLTDFYVICYQTAPPSDYLN